MDKLTIPLGNCKEVTSELIDAEKAKLPDYKLVETVSKDGQMSLEFEKIDRTELIEKALIKKGVITQAEIDAEKVVEEVVEE
jgi:hypothetical protein